MVESESGENRFAGRIIVTIVEYLAGLLQVNRHQKLIARAQGAGDPREQLVTLTDGGITQVTSQESHDHRFRLTLP
jgi:hypothetical protein